MTRIIAGVARGRRLAVPSRGTRPTSDRVRESCFSTLTSDLDADDTAWSGVRALDLFAGSGALGLEALSRGASGAVFVESNRDAARVLRSNVDALGLDGAVVVELDVARLTSVPPAASTVLPANVVFADPPYEFSASRLSTLLETLHSNEWIAPDARIVVERSAKDDAFPMPESWMSSGRRTYGDTALWYGRVNSHRGGGGD